MSLPEYYPSADHKAQWRPDLAGGGTFTTVEKLLLHSTETRDWPSYPTFAPHMTYNPWTHRWRQHMPLTRSATTLEDPSSTPVRENRDHVIQVEIVGYCDPDVIKKYGHSMHDLDNEALSDLGVLARWLRDHAGLPLQSTVKWVDYPQSYGLDAPQRLSSSRFDQYKGILGHEHASGNHHGDPGKINIAEILHYAGAATQSEMIKLWTIKHADAFDGHKNRRPELDLRAGTQVTGKVDHHFANDGRYFQTGKLPHRVWYALDNGDWSHKKDGTPIK